LECPSCQHANPEGSRFCLSCGSALALRCGRCEAELPSGARFCNHCGAPTAEGPDATGKAEPSPFAPRSPRDYTPAHLADKILQSQSVLRGERKTVSVLFADVRRSTELAKSLDPEDWHAILDRFFQILADGVHRFEGTVNQYTGDGIMALFGAPIAHEDHALRACYASLHLLDALRVYAREVKREHGVDFAVRLGLNAGEVVVGKIGDDLRMDYTAQGATVHLASRMQELAEAGTAYLAPEIAALVEGWFELEDLGEFRVRGADAPVPVRALLGLGGVKSRFDVSRARGLVRFVGRETEMRTLDAALERAFEGNGQVVGVVAEAGTGKSRLCFEFAERCRARGLRVVEGRCVAHGKNLPLHPVLEVVRAYFGVTEHDDARGAREKIAGRMLLIDESYREVLPVLFEFLGVPDPQRPAPTLSPEARQRQLFSVLRRLTREGPEPGIPVGIVLFEDLHWIDAGSETWLEEWVDAVVGAPTLLVANFRPEYRADWMQRAHYQQLALAPLSADAIRELILDLLGSDESTEGLAERIHAHTAGNPFFAEEVVQTLIESGQLEGSRGAYRLVTPVERLEVPARVNDLLAARIDRLAEREKRLLQIASVIGKDFEEPLLEAVAELPSRELTDSLAILRSGEFVREQAMYPVAEYTFKHPLTQQVALDSLLRDRRREIHTAVAGAIEARGGDLEERAPLLAHHWEEAGEPLTAAGWHLRAAYWIGPSDVSEMERHARAVLALLCDREEIEGATHLLARTAALLLNMGWRIGMDDGGKSLYEDGRRWARAAGDGEIEARLAGSYAATLCVAGEIDLSLSVGAEFVAIAHRMQDPDLIVVSEAWMSYPTLHLGETESSELRIRAAIERGEQSPELGVAFLGSSLTGLLYQWLVNIEIRSKPWPEAQRTRDRGLAWARERGELENEMFLLMVSSDGLLLAGERERALAEGRQALARAEESGSPLGRCASRRSLARALVANGDPDAGISVLEEARAESLERRIDLEYEASYPAILAEAELRRGHLAEALARAEEAVALVERRRTAMFRPEILETLARCQIAGDDLDAAAASLDRMESEAERLRYPNFAPRATWLRADLAGRRGDAAARRALLHGARDGFIERGMPANAERVQLELREGESGVARD